MEPEVPSRPCPFPPAIGHDRRAFLRRSAVAGGLAWAAPAVLTVTRGQAQEVSPAPPRCACTSNAFGLRVVIPALNIDVVLGDPSCLEDTGTIGLAGTATVRAEVVCARAGEAGGTCRASASIAELELVVGPVLVPTLRVSATVLTSNASASCDPCATTGDSSIASLVVNDIAVDVDSLTCNNDVLDLGVVVFNEQACDGETLNVNALHVTVPGIVEVIVAHSEAGATDCPCTPCA